MPLTIPGQTPLPSLGLAATARIIDAVPDGPDSPAADTATALLDYDRIDRPLAVRARRPGDRITIPAGGTKKLSDLLIDAKVPKDQRDRVPLLVSGTDIIWVFGRLADGRFAPTAQTRRLLVVTFEQPEG